MIRIGIICPSEIALRRFLPALNQLEDMEFVGVAVADKTEWEGASDEIINAEKRKAESFVTQYGGKIFSSYISMIQAEEIDAIYLPLPPALHYQWARQALEAGKHILLEKPATTSLKHTNNLIELAKKNKLAIHENYMFAFHEQLHAINNLILEEKIGDVRLYRISFGFPRRASNDFRYIRALGGGALLDAGGYTIKYASILLGKTARVAYAQSNYTDEFEIDISGSGALVNNTGTTVQVAFGMDNDYKCDLEVWGSKGSITTGRVLTAPAGFTPDVTLKNGNETISLKLPADDAFKKSIHHFKRCIDNDSLRQNNYMEVGQQAQLIQSFIEKAKTK